MTSLKLLGMAKLERACIGIIEIPIQKYIRKIQKVRYSYYLILPKEIIRNLDWKEKQKVVIKKSGKRIIIQDWKK